MKQSEAKEFLPLIKAWSEGKTLQYKTDGAWKSVGWDDGDLYFSQPHLYRIKPEPREFWAVISNGTVWGSTSKALVEETWPNSEVIHAREVVND